MSQLIVALVIVAIFQQWMIRKLKRQIRQAAEFAIQNQSQAASQWMRSALSLLAMGGESAAERQEGE